MKNSGLAWHCHHDILMEYVYDFKERVEAIKQKDKSEVKTRLRLFKFVSDSALKLFPKEFLEAYQKYREARQKRKEVYHELHEANQKRNEAYQRWDEAYQKWEEEIEKIHSQDCGCKEWNGKEIVFEEKI